MILIEDTRQQANKHKIKHDSFEAAGDILYRSKLIVGDYALPPSIAVDTKQDVKEIASNMCGSIKDKQRFTRECKKANEIGCKLIFLIEDKHYQTIDDLYGKKVYMMSGVTIPGDQLALAMITMANRYGVEFRFCKPEDSAEIIKEILNTGRNETILGGESNE